MRENMMSIYLIRRPGKENGGSVKLIKDTKGFKGLCSTSSFVQDPVFLHLASLHIYLES